MNLLFSRFFPWHNILNYYLGVPAPPPEFSGAAPLSASDEEDHQQATDVEEDSQSYILHQIQPELQKQPEIDSHMEPVAETTPIDIIVTADDDDIDDEKAEAITDDKPFQNDVISSSNHFKFLK